jgi:hypothetical protein
LSGDEATKIPHDAHYAPVDAVAPVSLKYPMGFQHLDLGSDASKGFCIRAGDQIKQSSVFAP